MELVTLEKQVGLGVCHELPPWGDGGLGIDSGQRLPAKTAHVPSLGGKRGNWRLSGALNPSHGPEACAAAVGKGLSLQGWWPNPVAPPASGC